MPDPSKFPDPVTEPVREIVLAVDNFPAEVAVVAELAVVAEVALVAVAAFPDILIPHVPEAPVPSFLTVYEV